MLLNIIQSSQQHYNHSFFVIAVRPLRGRKKLYAVLLPRYDRDAANSFYSFFSYLTQLFLPEHRTSNIEHRTSNIEHRTSNIELRTSNIERRTSNIEHRTSNIEHRTSNIEHRTSNIEHRTSKIEHRPSHTKHKQQ